MLNRFCGSKCSGVNGVKLCFKQREVSLVYKFYGDETEWTREVLGVHTGTYCQYIDWYNENKKQFEETYWDVKVVVEEYKQPKRLDEQSGVCERYD